MGKIVQVALPDELDAEVKAAVASGDFACESDVIQAAVEEWRANRMIEQIGVEKLRRMVEEGIASGPSIDGDKFFARLDAKYSGKAAE